MTTLWLSGGKHTRQIATPSFTMLTLLNTILIDITTSSNLLLLTFTRCRAVAPRLPNPIFERFRQLWSVAPSFTRRHRSPLIILHHVPYYPPPSSDDRMMMTMFISRSFHYKLLSDSQQGQSKLGCGNIGKVEIGTWETAVLRLEAMCYFFIIELKDK